MTENRGPSCSALVRFLRGDEPQAPVTLVVAAHPDDEVIGLGGQLQSLGRRLHVLQVTDGAPRDMRDAADCGFATREAYADARRRELLAALSLAGIGPEHTSVFGVPDQEASLDLAGLTRRVAEVLTWLRPQCVVTPAYEGGHPDHDAVAFAAWAARALLRRAGLRAAEGIEFPLYHAGSQGMVSGRFAAGGPPALVLSLSPAQRELKRRMVACFRTQQAVLAAFPLDAERLRCVPERDFREPPHPGPLHYDTQPWGMDGARWRALAAAALEELELSPGALEPLWA